MRALRTKIKIEKIVIMNYFLVQSSSLLTQAMAFREKKLIKNICLKSTHSASLIESIVLIEPGSDNHKAANNYYAKEKSEAPIKPALF
jgi:hypothetical protein